jgi:phage terminase large subunit GpA-like protein
VALVGFADLQRDRAYVEIRGLTVRAEQSLLVWCGEVACPADQPGSLHALDKIVRGRWPHPSGAMVPVAALAIDSGDGARTLEVYHWTGTHGNVYASKGVAGSGSGSQGMVRPWTLDLAEYDPAAGERGMKPMSAAPGRVRSGRVRFLTINTNVYKSRAMAVLQQARADPAKAALRFCEAGERTARYVEHLTAEHLVRRTRPDGRVVLAWELRPGRTDNHHWDTLVGCMALTDAMGAEEQLTPEATAAAMARWRPEAVAAPVRAEGGGGGSAWAMGGAGGWTL